MELRVRVRLRVRLRVRVRVRVRVRMKEVYREGIQLPRNCRRVDLKDERRGYQAWAGLGLRSTLGLGFGSQGLG